MNLLTENYDSSLIDSSNYNPSNGELLITFKTGDIYKFENVVTEDYQQLIDGESAGKAFNLYIRKYTGTKIEDYQQINENAG